METFSTLDFEYRRQNGSQNKKGCSSMVQHPPLRAPSKNQACQINVLACTLKLDNSLIPPNVLVSLSEGTM